MATQTRVRANPHVSKLTHTRQSPPTQATDQLTHIRTYPQSHTRQNPLTIVNAEPSRVRAYPLASGPALASAAFTRVSSLGASMRVVSSVHLHRFSSSYSTSTTNHRACCKSKRGNQPPCRKITFQHSTQPYPIPGIDTSLVHSRRVGAKPGLTSSITLIEPLSKRGRTDPVPTRSLTKT